MQPVRSLYPYKPPIAQFCTWWISIAAQLEGYAAYVQLHESSFDRFASGNDIDEELYGTGENTTLTFEGLGDDKEEEEDEDEGSDDSSDGAEDLLRSFDDVEWGLVWWTLYIRTIFN